MVFAQQLLLLSLLWLAYDNSNCVTLSSLSSTVPLSRRHRPCYNINLAIDRLCTSSLRFDLLIRDFHSIQSVTLPHSERERPQVLYCLNLSPRLSVAEVEDLFQSPQRLVFTVQWDFY